VPACKALGLEGEKLAYVNTEPAPSVSRQERAPGRSGSVRAGESFSDIDDAFAPAHSDPGGERHRVVAVRLPASLVEAAEALMRRRGERNLDSLFCAALEREISAEPRKEPPGETQAPRI
jgi:hypothetical protein